TEGEFMNGSWVDFEGKGLPRMMHLYDGGVRDHSPAGKILESTHYGLTEIARVYSRPYNYELLDSIDYYPKSVVRVLDRLTQITNVEVSKNDEQIENDLIGSRGIWDHGCFFLPRIMQGVYD